MSTNPVAGQYTTTQINSLSTYLVDLFKQGGYTLPYPVAQAWIRSEQGVNGNVLGVTNASHQLYSYSSPEQGLQAAYQNFANNPAYAQARTVLKNPSSTTQQIASAINYTWPGRQGYPTGSPIAILAGPGPSSRGLGNQTVGQNIAPDTTSANTSSVQSLVGNVIPDVQSAVGFIGIILIGLAFVIGSFILSGKDKASNVSIIG